MTTYGTIPTSLPISTNPNFISEAKEQIKSTLGSQRPWMEMAQMQKIKIPASMADSMQRLYNNISLYRMNYAIVILFVLFLNLLWHPLSLIVFAAVSAAWMFLYFLRDGQEMVIMGRAIDDRAVLMGLTFMTIFSLCLTNAKNDMTVGLSVGVVIVLLHAAFYGAEDVFMAEGNATSNVDNRTRGDVPKLPIQHVASSSASYSRA